MMFHVPHKFRLRTGPMGSTDDAGNNGAFLLPYMPIHPRQLRAIASDGMDWQHVSVSLPNRCPTWEEMCYVKGLFWDPEDCVIQYHPPESDYVNCHPNCLHLWRPVGVEIPRPPAILVGIK